MGLIYASGVESKWRRGLYAEALRNSEEAGRWTKIGFAIGIAFYIIYLLIAILVPVLGFGIGFPFFSLMHGW